MTVAVNSRNTIPFLKIWVVSWTGIFLLLGALGITTSSLSLIAANEVGSVSSASVISGEPRSIRSDEFFRSTPWDIGLLKSGNANFVTPFAHQNTSLIYPDPDSWIDYVNAFDTIWPRLIPGISISQEFAFTWWTPIWIALIFLPLLLVRMGASFVVSVCVTTLIIASPVNAWWSLWISPIVGFSAMAAYLFLLAISGEKRKYLLKFLYVVGSSYGLFKLLTCYQPWVIVIAPMILFTSFAFAIEAHGWKRVSKSLFTIVAIFASISALFLSKNWDALTTLTSTLYPGERRSSGAFVSTALTWGAPHLQILNGTPKIIDSNYSELSSSFSILLLASLALIFSTKEVVRKNYLLLTSLSIVFIWTIWVSVNVPQSFSSLPVISFVTPSRAAAVLGIISALLFAMSTTLVRNDKEESDSSKQVEWRLIGVGIFAGLLTLISGLALQESVPRLGMIRITIASIIASVLTYLMCLSKTRVYGLIGLSLFSVFMVYQINPLQRSLVGLVYGQVPSNLNSMNKEYGYWVSDSKQVDALLMANSIKSLSGQQLMGPSLEIWSTLDPDQISTSQWNRGASYLTFVWDANKVPLISNPVGDVIQVNIDPCQLKLSQGSLMYLVSSKTLSDPCLERVYEFEQLNTVMSVYEFRTSTQ